MNHPWLFALLSVLLTACGSSAPGSDDDPSDDGDDDGGMPLGDSCGESGEDYNDGLPTTPTPASDGSACADLYEALVFTNAIDDGDWFNIDLEPSDGMEGILAAMITARDEHEDEPVRIRLAEGTYEGTEGVGEMFLVGLTRTAATPVWVVATDPSPNATNLEQGLNLVAFSYVAFEGLTIGPATVGAYNAGSQTHADPQPINAQAGFHFSGTAIDGSTNALVCENDGIDFSIYGRYLPTHHILLRNVTIQNIFDPAEESGMTAEGHGADGIKFNQASDVAVLDSRIRQTSRHGIDNVAVRQAVFCGNVIAENGGGLGIEAKGGAVDVIFDSNTFIRVRRFELGGEATDATYYWSAEERADSDEHYQYEGRRIVARNNLVIDPTEAGIEFSGCHDCAAIHNTIYFTADYDGDGDALREHPSEINREGAGSDCYPLTESGTDTESIELCWGVSSTPSGLSGRTLSNTRNVLLNNIFYAAEPIWMDRAPYNPTGGGASGFMQVDGNLWFNGGAAIDETSVGLIEGSATQYNVDPSFADEFSLGMNPFSDATTAHAALRVAETGPANGSGVDSPANGAPYDRTFRLRSDDPALGALEP